MQPDKHSEEAVHTNGIAILPRPTAWPIVLAIGLTLAFASLVTNTIIGYLGGFLILVSAVGWFREVLPHEQHEVIEVATEEIVFTSTRTAVERLKIGQPATESASAGHERKSVGGNPIVAGIKGGIAGGIAMVFPALLYGQLRYHSIWYTVNLLGGAGVAALKNADAAQIAQFHWGGLLVASLIQGSTCLLVGLLYGALLPILPKHPILLGGIVAPALWTGILHSSLGLINPFLDARIDWWWFSLSQVTFGIVAGIIVARLGNLRELSAQPFAVRLGIETPGLGHDHPHGGSQ